jgi:hypothetical protein
VGNTIPEDDDLVSQTGPPPRVWGILWIPGDLWWTHKTGHKNGFA